MNYQGKCVLVYNFSNKYMIYHNLVNLIKNRMYNEFSLLCPDCSDISISLLGNEFVKDLMILRIEGKKTIDNTNELTI